MNIFIREMKAHRKSLIIWSIGMIFLLLSGMVKFAAYASSGQSVNELMTKLPKSMKVIFGIGSFDLSKATGFYGLLFLYFIIMATIHASMLGANIISKEERDKTSEFLMVKPVSRNSIITSKLLASLANIGILNIVTYVSSIMLVSYYAKGESITRDISVLMVAMLILQLIFLFIGTSIAAVSKNPKTASSAATVLLLVTFILSLIINMNDKLENLKYFSPFKYYEANNLMYGGSFEPIFIILSFMIITILLGVTYIFYKKRDLNI